MRPVNEPAMASSPSSPAPMSVSSPSFPSLSGHHLPGNLTLPCPPWLALTSHQCLPAAHTLQGFPEGILSPSPRAGDRGALAVLGQTPTRDSHSRPAPLSTYFQCKNFMAVKDLGSFLRFLAV